ncbi:hypothetical protein DL764_006028 [Monosporascus ibericus]|uniref:Uncharacterized protein n=1 Tax=Monosporascus ibericus TaxID=155417 RepID=A0A4Q4TA79_9PEZI|nr:hypothetical protein DL764_006028 [Monosporascus ibericus]
MATAVPAELVTTANDTNALAKLYRSFVKKPEPENTTSYCSSSTEVSTASSKRRQDDVDADIPAKHVKVEPDPGSSSG